MPDKSTFKPSAEMPSVEMQKVSKDLVRFIVVAAIVESTLTVTLVMLYLNHVISADAFPTYLMMVVIPFSVVLFAGINRFKQKRQALLDKAQSQEQSSESKRPNLIS
ncbi:MAG: hypothetical protein VKJ04_03920 [Vampirovibrionales bacterium]|nr:hypothetical protein [Vampirovibrionales bacterium]